MICVVPLIPLSLANSRHAVCCQVFKPPVLEQSVRAHGLDSHSKWKVENDLHCDHGNVAYSGTFLPVSQVRALRARCWFAVIRKWVPFGT